MAETSARPRRWFGVLMGAITALVVGSVSMLPLMLSPRFQDARTAYWALGLPGVESVEVGTITRIYFTDAANQGELATALTKAQGRKFTWVDYHDITVRDAGALGDPIAFARLLWLLGHDGEFEGQLERGPDAAAHGGLLAYRGDDDCRAAVSAALHDALELQSAWQDLGLHCPAETHPDANYFVRLASGEDSSIALDLLAAHQDRLFDVMIDFSQERRLTIGVADPADFDPVRNDFLDRLGTDDWAYFMATRGTEGATFNGTDDASAAVTLAGQLIQAGLEPRWMRTNLSEIRVVDEGLDQLPTVIELVPSGAKLDLRRARDSGFYTGPADRLAALMEPLLTIERSGGQPEWSTDRSQLRLTTPSPDHGCDQAGLGCAELASAIARLPGPVTVEAGTAGARTVFICHPGAPAEVTEQHGSRFADELIAAWDALA